MSSLRHAIVLTFLAALGFGSLAHADEPTLSAAEQAALAAQNPVDDQYLINLCHHALLYGSDEQKAETLAQLGDQTCAEAVAAGNSGQ